MASREKILITGGAGQIGDMITNELKNDYDIIVVDIKKPRVQDIKFICDDLSDIAKVKEFTKGIDCIIHLAAYSREGTIPSYPEGWQVNCTDTFNVFEAAVANNVKKVVFASSICAVGPITWTSPDHSIQYFPIDEQHPPLPENLYGTSKLIGENLARMYTRRSATSFVGLRLATVWFKTERGIDPTTELFVSYVKDPASVERLPQTERRRFAFKDLPWQYVDARDVVQAFRLGIEKTIAGYEIFNIGADDTPSDWESFKLAKYFYPEVPIRDPMIFLMDQKRALWDISKAKKELGYKPLYNWKEYIQ
jgi:nucleoside-diphosphate-sugar epimerase